MKNVMITGCASGIGLATAKKFIDLLLSGDKGMDTYINPETSPALIIEFIGGEPFLEIELIDQICDYFFHEMIRLDHPWMDKHMFSICSNGVLYFDPRVQKFLNKHKDNLSFSITIDGNKDVYFGDIFLFLNLAVRGKVHCINQKTGVYRRNEGGVSFQMSLVKAQRLIKQYLFMMHHFKDYPDLVEYSKYCVQIYCWYIMYESDASIWEKFRYLRLERNISDTKMLTKSTLSYCLTLIKKTILHRK